MAMGPLELVVLSFPTIRLCDGVQTTLRQLRTATGMKVVDVLVVRVDVTGRARTVELSELPGLRGQVPPTTGLISQVDVAEVAQLVDDVTDALAVLLEHRWVLALERPVAASAGSIVAMIHISGAPVAAGI